MRFIILIVVAILISCSVHGQKKDTVRTGLYLKNLYDLHPEDYSFTADFWIWFNTKNHRFDALKNIEVVNAKQSNFSDGYNEMQNAVHVSSESCKAILNHDWKLKNFPFDTQKLEIQIEAGLDTSQMILKADAEGFKVFKKLKLPGWNIKSYQASERMISYDSDFGDRRLKGNSTYSRITYSLELSRLSWGLYFKLFIGLYISFLVAFMVFFVSPLRDQKFGLSIGGLFAAVGNKYVMDSNIPSTVSFSFVDKVHDLTFLFILMTLVLSVISLKRAEKGHIRRAERFDKICAFVMLGLYVITNLGLVLEAYS